MRGFRPWWQCWRRRNPSTWSITTAFVRLFFVIAVFVGLVTLLDHILNVPTTISFPLLSATDDTVQLQQHQFPLPASFVRLDTFPSSNRQSWGGGADDSRPHRVQLVLSVNLTDLSELVEAYRQGFAPAEERFPDDGGIVVRNEALCRGAKHPLSWVVVVHSAPQHFAQRQMLRSTWANIKLFTNIEFRVAFLLGLPAVRSIELEENLRAEFIEYGDLVQGNFTDSYRNMTLKAVMGLRWLTQFCGEAQYVIKADDDTFLNIFEIVSVMEANVKKQNVIICPLWPDNSMPILRDPKTCMKWCVKRRDLRGKTHFPKYCAGIGYVMSRDLVPSLYNASKTTPFFWIDDVYVTGLLVQKLTAKPTYVDILNRLAMHDELALAEYRNQSIRTLEYWYVHAKDMTNFATLWKSLVTRLTDQQRSIVNTDVLKHWTSQ